MNTYKFTALVAIGISASSLHSIQGMQQSMQMPYLSPLINQYRYHIVGALALAGLVYSGCYLYRTLQQTTKIKSSPNPATGSGQAFHIPASPQETFEHHGYKFVHSPFDIILIDGSMSMKNVKICENNAPLNSGQTTQGVDWNVNFAQEAIKAFIQNITPKSNYKMTILYKNHKITASTGAKLDKVSSAITKCFMSPDASSQTELNYRN